METNPLLLDVVLNVFLNNLNFEDLKRCRLVCSKWKELCEPVFKRRVIVSFRLTQSNMTDPDSIDTIMMFRNRVYHPGIPWQAFRFENCIPYDPPIFEDVVLAHASSINELHFVNMMTIMSMPKYDLQPLIGPNINKLTITGTQYHYPNEMQSVRVKELEFKISWKYFQSLSYLHLKSCTVNLENERISPKDLHLEDIHFKRNGCCLDNLLINRILSPARLENLFINGHGSCPLTLDVSLETGALKFLSIKQVDVLNWDKRTWSTERLLLIEWPMYRVDLLHDYLQATDIEIQNYKYDLNSIPQNVEKLFLKLHYLQTNSPDINFPKLKHLTLYNNPQVLHKLSGCTQLQDLLLYKDMLRRESFPVPPVIPPYHYHEPLNFNAQFFDDIGEAQEGSGTVNVDWIPLSVKRLLIQKFDIKGHGIFNLDTLVVLDYNDHELERLLTRIKAQTLVIYSAKIKEFGSFIISLIHFYAKLVIGKIQNSENSFKNSLISNYVDKESEYYVFENRIGKGITEKEFNEFLTFK